MVVEEQRQFANRLGAIPCSTSRCHQIFQTDEKGVSLVVALSQTLHRSTETHPRARKLLLGCGIFATALYFTLDVVASLRHDSYSYTGQTISELSAFDAPTRTIWIPFGLVYSVLMIAYGFGVWVSAVGKRAQRIVGILAAVMGVLGLVAWPFAPMHQRKVLAAGGATLADTMHIILGAVDTLIFILSTVFGSTVLGRRFRFYSIATILAVLIAGTLTAREAPKVANDEPTPWIGVTERIAVFGSMLWYAVLAIGLLRAQDTATLSQPGKQ